MTKELCRIVKNEFQKRGRILQGFYGLNIKDGLAPGFRPR